MTTRRHMAMLATVLITLMGSAAFAQGRGQGQGQKSDKSDRPTNANVQNGSLQVTFGSWERDIFRGWYRDHENNLPPGLAKRDRLPPGLENQLRERGTLPPGLQKKIVALPVDLARLLPPPPSGCNRVVIGGNIVLIDAKTFYVHAVFTF
jgi:hypothetical protein